MFWKLITLALVLWAVGMYFSVTFAGFIHLLPVAAIVCVIVRQMSKQPDTEYGRWRSAAERSAPPLTLHSLLPSARGFRALPREAGALFAGLRQAGSTHDPLPDPRAGRGSRAQDGFRGVRAQAPGREPGGEATTGRRKSGGIALNGTEGWVLLGQAFLARRGVTGASASCCRRATRLSSGDTA